MVLTLFRSLLCWIKCNFMPNKHAQVMDLAVLLYLYPQLEVMLFMPVMLWRFEENIIAACGFPIIWVLCDLWTSLVDYNLLIIIIIILFSLKDVAIAYGFNKIPKTKPTSLTQGRQQPLNQITDLIRLEVLIVISFFCMFLYGFHSMWPFSCFFCFF